MWGIEVEFAQIVFFSGVFAKVRKANISFVMPVRPEWNYSAPTGRIFM
jgi:hypothetical protein